MIAQKVSETRQKQLKDRGKLNSNLSSQEIKDQLWVSHAVKDLLNKAAEKLDLTARGYIKTLRVAQTIADFENEPEMKPEHVAEALQFRKINTLKIVN